MSGWRDSISVEELLAEAATSSIEHCFTRSFIEYAVGAEEAGGIAGHHALEVRPEENIPHLPSEVSLLPFHSTPVQADYSLLNTIPTCLRGGGNNDPDLVDILDNYSNTGLTQFLTQNSVASSPSTPPPPNADCDNTSDIIFIGDISEHSPSPQPISDAVSRSDSPSSDGILANALAKEILDLKITCENQERIIRYERRQKKFAETRNLLLSSERRALFRAGKRAEQRYRRLNKQVRLLKQSIASLVEIQEATTTSINNLVEALHGKTGTH